MADKVSRDAVTGVDTTGHEWDGIRELDNPLPRWWVYTFYASTIVAVVDCGFSTRPGPGAHGYLGGVLALQRARRFRAADGGGEGGAGPWLDRIAASDAATIHADPELLQFAIAGGEVRSRPIAHPATALGGAGQGFFPTLADDDWLWGGDLEQIEYTIRHGIRNGQDPDARDNAMPAFGADGLLDPAQIADVTQYVLSLTKRQTDEARRRGRGDLRRELRRLPWRGRRGHPTSAARR